MQPTLTCMMRLRSELTTLWTRLPPSLSRKGIQMQIALNRNVYDRTRGYFMNKRDTIAAIGQKTRLRNHDIQQVVETLLEVWTEELVAGGRIEIQNFLVLETNIQQ